MAPLDSIKHWHVYEDEQRKVVHTYYWQAAVRMMRRFLQKRGINPWIVTCQYGPACPLRTGRTEESAHGTTH